MKYILIITSIVAPISSMIAMQTCEIRNRELHTLNKPHITIINQLPTDNPHFLNTRIDISDKTKIDVYTKEMYQPDESTVTIWPNRGIRFSPRTHKTAEPDYKRLGMNDTGDAALITIYVHGANDRSLNHLVIGKGSLVAFGDTITITADPDGSFALISHRDGLVCTIPVATPEEKQTVEQALLMGIPDARDISYQNISYEDLDELKLMSKNSYYLDRLLPIEEFLKENTYIANLLHNYGSENDGEEAYITIDFKDNFERLLRNNSHMKDDLAKMFPLTVLDKFFSLHNDEK